MQVLLLDEVTTFVDAEDQQRVMETVRRCFSAVSAAPGAQNDTFMMNAALLQPMSCAIDRVLHFQ